MQAENMARTSLVPEEEAASLDSWSAIAGLHTIKKCTQEKWGQRRTNTSQRLEECTTAGRVAALHAHQRLAKGLPAAQGRQAAHSLTISPQLSRGGGAQEEVRALLDRPPLHNAACALLQLLLCTKGTDSRRMDIHVPVSPSCRPQIPVHHVV